MNGRMSSVEQSTRSSSTSLSPPPKVTKRRASRPNSLIAKMIEKRPTPLITSLTQPSEEDLFYLLIHKLKRRDQAEAAATALNEEMEAKLQEVSRENETLKNQLKQAETLHIASETEKVAQRGLIERWKVKFNKLRNLMITVGDGHELLRRDGQLLKSVQTALVQGSNHLQINLKELATNTGEINETIAQKNLELANMQSDLVALKHQVLLTDNKLKSSEDALAQEKSRTATLEAYIRAHSSKSLKRIASLQHTYAETSSKIESLCKGLKEFIAVSQSSVKTELSASLKTCVEMLGKVSTREFEASMMAKIESALQEFAAK